MYESSQTCRRVSPTVVVFRRDHPGQKDVPIFGVYGGSVDGETELLYNKLTQ